MSRTLNTIFIFACLVIAAAQGQQSFGQYVLKQTQKRCKRKLVKVMANNNYYARMTAKRACVSLKKKGAKFGALRWAMFSSNLPRFRFWSYAGTANLQDASNTLFGAQLSFTKILEYKEGNGEPGYQHNSTDTVIKTHYLRTNNKTEKWSPISVDEIAVSDSEKIYEASMTLKKDSTGFADYRFGWQFTPAEYEDTKANSTKKVVLSPASAKLTIKLSNITWSPEATGFAFETILMGKRAFRNRTTAEVETSSSDEEFVDQPSDKNEAYDLPDEDGNDAGRFTWRKEILANATSFVNMYGSDWVEVSSVDSNIDNSENLKMFRAWFSTKEQADSFEWDPSLGSSSEEDTTSSASALASHGFSFLVVCLVSIAYLLF